MSAKPIEVTDANFDAEVLSADLPVLIDFWATWCAPCKAIAPHLEKLAAEKDGQLKVVKIEADKHRKSAAAFKVTSLPTFVVVRGGKEVARKIGATGGLAELQKLVAPALGA